MFRAELVYDFVDEANVILGCLFSDGKVVTYRDKDERVKFKSEWAVDFDMKDDIRFIAIVDSHELPLGLVNSDLNIDIRVRSLDNVKEFIYANSFEYVPNVNTDHVELIRLDEGTFKEVNEPIRLKI